MKEIIQRAKNQNLKMACFCLGVNVNFFEQKKNLKSGKRISEVHGPDSERISKEVEEVIKRIEDKKTFKKRSSNRKLGIIESRTLGIV